ncbi:hypothetical protein BGZ49_000967 [Haplosporangium sp. Z 27]|nr:hypothetical protein BGZ49_000967 [Haplosporangium sp. Z 27]
MPKLFNQIILFVSLWLELSLLVTSTIVISYPRANTKFVPDKTYHIKLFDDHLDKDVKDWKVDLIVIGAECDGICLHNGIVAEISKSYNTKSALHFKVPINLLQHGKVFQIQFSNAGSTPIYQSEIFTIKKTSFKRSNDASEVSLKKRDISIDTEIRTSENSAPFVLPTVLATTLVLGFSCVFAYFMI